MSMTRKQFLGTMMAAAGAAMLAGCGGDDGGGGGDIDASTGGSDAPSGGDDAGIDALVQRSCTDNGTSVTIGGNHGHVLVVSKADVAAGAEKIYDITGTSLHSHEVTVSAANFAMLQSDPNSSLSLTSTMGDSDHTHSITIICA